MFDLLVCRPVGSNLSARPWRGSKYSRKHVLFLCLLWSHPNNRRLTHSHACQCYAVRKDANQYGKGIDSNALEFHSDQGATDLIALLSISAAKEGGESLLVSTIAIHNELLRRGRKVRRILRNTCATLCELGESFRYCMILFKRSTGYCSAGL